MADSIREALTKAVAEAEAASAATPEPAKTPASEPPVDEKVPAGTDASEGSRAATEADTTTPPGAGPSADATTPKPAAAASSPAPGNAAQTPSSQQQGANQASATEPPPASWSAEERKHWAGVPKEAQAAIRRRETEMRRAITAAQEATQHKRHFDQSVERFQPLLKEKGVTDIMGQVIGPLLTMRAGLEIGTPEQKAGLIATIVRDFGIGIDVLDKALEQMANSGALHPGSRPPPAPAFNPRQVPELAPLFQMAERLEAAQKAKAEAAVAEVSSLPDFEDLRDTMADIVERATSQGKQLTVLEAYDRARAFYGMEPRVKPQISVSEAASALARSRNAASSVSGAPKTSPAKKPNDLRGQLEAAWSSAHS